MEGNNEHLLTKEVVIFIMHIYLVISNIEIDDGTELLKSITREEFPRLKEIPDEGCGIREVDQRSPQPTADRPDMGQGQAEAPRTLPILRRDG